MPQSWELLNCSSNTAVASLSLSSKDFGGHDISVEKKTLRGGLQEGVDLVTVRVGKLSFSIIPTRGMGIWKAKYGEMEVGWKSPVNGPVHPNYVPVAEPSGLGWLDGFDEMLVRCGLESNGAPEFTEKEGRLLHPLHGKIANKPAISVAIQWDESTKKISVIGVVEEKRFHFLKLRMTCVISATVGGNTIEVADTIKNLSAGPAEFQMLYHANFGSPILDGGAQFVGAVKRVVPRNDHAASGLSSWNSYLAPTTGYEEQVYFLDMIPDSNGWTQAMLKNAHGTHAVRLRYPKENLPCFSLWKDTGSLEDGYVTGLEPGTNYPNPRSFEGKHGRVGKLAAGGEVTLKVNFDLLVDAASVSKAEAEIQTLQGKTTPEIAKSPLPELCS